MHNVLMARRGTLPGIRAELLAVSGLVLLAWMLRMWQLEAKGLWYDEAATALMAQAPPADIILFHWTSAFEHPPLWALLMHGWLKLFGQSESALRWPSVMAGTVTVPLLWVFMKCIWPHDRTTRLLAAFLVTLSPILLEYSQEARMYSLVAALGVLSLYALLRLLRGASLRWATGWVLANWLLTGFHYYAAATLLLSQGLFALLVIAVTHRRRADLLTLLALSSVPLLLWVQLSPAFQTTAEQIVQSPQVALTSYLDYMARTWRDFTFGNLRGQPDRAALGYLVWPLLLVGLGVAGRHAITHRPGTGESVATGGWLLALSFLVPWLFSMVLFQGLQTRYILLVVPPLCALTALGIARLWRVVPLLGWGGLLLVGSVLLLGVFHYFTSYQKSEYREMAAYLRAHIEGPSVPVLMEAPRQHLLARYYLGPSLNLHPVPNIALPEHWPVTAPPIVPGEVAAEAQALLTEHDALWLILTAEDEVDPGGFLPAYLTAIAYPGGCREWLDVRLCHYLNPERISSALDAPLAYRFGSELLLEEAGLSLAEMEGTPHLLMRLTWQALQRPTRDYKVTVRLLDEAGQPLLQEDDFPIGPLLPPTTWAAGDVKPGYHALPLPTALPTGTYQMVVGVYDPHTLAPIPHTGPDGTTSAEFISFATVAVDTEIELLPISEAALE